jgi:hypothetical protein
MPLPAFNSYGDLPEGVYKASLDEVVARCGHGTPQRQTVDDFIAPWQITRHTSRRGIVEVFVEVRSTIANDQELQGTQERMAFFYRLLAQMRVTATTPEEYRLFSDSYLAELERMHAEVLTYLKRHVSEPVPAEAA